MTEEQKLSLEHEIKILKEENEILKKKLVDFKNLEEELTAKRVYDLAYERIKRLITFGGILTIIVGIIGYKTIMDKADTVVSRMDSIAVLNMAKTEIDTKVMPKLTSQLLSKANNEIKIITDSIKPVLTQQIKNQVDALSKPYNLTFATATKDSSSELKSSNVLPSFIDLSKNMNPVRNEGSEGSVVGFAMASALEYIILKQKGEQVTISPRFIYNSIKQGHGDNGAYIKDGIKLLSTVGAIKESDWPYVAGQFNSLPPPNVKSAYHYKVKSYSKVDISIENFKKALAENLPIVVGISMTEADLSDAVSKTGIFPPFNPKDPIVGGHAICIVGYDDNAKRIKFKNCWGSDWGDNGYGYISYQDINGNIMSDAWIIKSVF